MTLIELVIVIAVVGILITLAVPSYQSYMLRVHRSEAIRMLLQASMCQERIHARVGSYDTSACRQTSVKESYRLAYRQPNTQSQVYTAMAVPKGQQRKDACGNLIMDQNGNRSVSAGSVSAMKCWSGR